MRARLQALHGVNSVVAHAADHGVREVLEDVLQLQALQGLGHGHEEELGAGASRKRKKCGSMKERV